MNKTAIKNMIEDGYCRMQRFDNIDWRHYRDEMFQSELKSEREHRGNRPESYTAAFGNPAPLSAKYFVIKFFGQALESTNVRPSDILHCRPSSLIAKGLVDRWPEYALEAFAGFDWDTFNKLDYDLCGIVFNDEVTA